MKKIITILMMTSLPVMAMSIDDAKNKLTQYGIAIPTVMVDTAVYSGSANKSKINDWILNGFAGDNNFIVHQGSSKFYISGMNNGNGWGDGIRNRDSAFQHITASGQNFGKFRVNMNNSVTGAQAYERYVGGLRSANADLFYESEDVMGEVNNRIGSFILDKANGIKPIVENIGRQLAASELGKDARAACANQVEFTLVDPLCTAIGREFAAIAFAIDPNSDIISEDQATLYDNNLDAIGDLADVLITLDGETFGDVF